MDRFVDFIEDIEPDHTAQAQTQPDQREVKVCLIDDGVKSHHAGLDENIACGESWARPRVFQDSHSPYTTSAKGHGTVMAYYIRRLCPGVRLYVAKLDPHTSPSGFTFTVESAAKVSLYVRDIAHTVLVLS